MWIVKSSEAFSRNLSSDFNKNGLLKSCSDTNELFRKASAYRAHLFGEGSLSLYGQLLVLRHETERSTISPDDIVNSTLGLLHYRTPSEQTIYTIL